MFSLLGDNVFVHLHLKVLTFGCLGFKFLSAQEGADEVFWGIHF